MSAGICACKSVYVHIDMSSKDRNIPNQRFGCSTKVRYILKSYKLAEILQTVYSLGVRLGIIGIGVAGLL